MPLIEDYGLLGDCHSAALVSRSGSIDWLCWPRFDAGACFAALLGSAEHGRWLIRPRGVVRATHRRYRPNTLILETEFETADGAVKLIDWMPPRDEGPSLIRQVVGLRNHVEMEMELCIRFDYGSVVPWVRRTSEGISAIAGPEGLSLSTPIPLHGKELKTVAEFMVVAGQEAPFSLVWHSFNERPRHPDVRASLKKTERWWAAWAERCEYDGPRRDAVLRSLLTLKALTYAPTGGIVAAPTTSLPERIGGGRNWDYRYCWLRDATFTLYALLLNGYRQEAEEWRRWLVRAVAGDPSQTNIMYGLAGERRLPELELPWLPGYEGSHPVRCGNQANEQFQLDVFGEVLDAMHLARRQGLPPDENAWRIERALLMHLETAWRRPDDGIWEVRGGQRHFVHSKVMAWVAFDRGVQAVERFGLSGPAERWRCLRAEVHREVCRLGFNADRNSFVQSYGSLELDASLLMMSLVGFLPPDDPRMRGTFEAIARELTSDGFVSRYRSHSDVDGIATSEGVFLPCTFWLADNLVQQGKREEAQTIFEKLLSLRNDLGLLSEEYDPRAGRLLGNFPQAFTHVGLLNTAHNLAGAAGPAHDRRRQHDS